MYRHERRSQKWFEGDRSYTDLNMKKKTCGIHGYNDDSAEGTVETNETRATRRYSFKFVDRIMLVKRRFMYE